MYVFHLTSLTCKNVLHCDLFHIVADFFSEQTCFWHIVTYGILNLTSLFKCSSACIKKNKLTYLQANTKVTATSSWK